MKRTSIKDMILFENDHLLLLNKPAGIASLDERVGDAINILRMAKAEWAEANVCHRLDKFTSGVMVLSKNQESYREMAQKFEKREVDKRYHAIVEGLGYWDNDLIELPLGKSRNGRTKVDHRSGKPSLTYVTALENFRHFTLVECRPVTGRQHQIRVHLSAQNVPICNDEVYGGTPPLLSRLKRNYSYNRQGVEEPMIKRMALHAQRISFEFRGELIAVSAPYPKDFEVLKKLLDRYDT